MIGHDFWLGKLLTVFMADRADLGRSISGGIKSMVNSSNITGRL